MAGKNILLTTARISSTCCHLVNLIHNVLSRFVGSTSVSILHRQIYGKLYPVLLLEWLKVCRMPKIIAMSPVIWAWNKMLYFYKKCTLHKLCTGSSIKWALSTDPMPKLPTWSANTKHDTFLSFTVELEMNQ
jgi:hypothetical protein